MLNYHPLKNCKDLIMKLEVQYLLPTSSSCANFYIYQLPKGLGIRKILAHDIRMLKNPQIRVDIFLIFTDSHAVMWVHSPTGTPHGNFINGVINPEIVYGKALTKLYRHTCLNIANWIAYL